MTFDPHHQWLGISPQSQPASYYRLLGLAELESDVDLIRAAADLRIAKVREHLEGPQSAAAAALLAELTVARLCLLDNVARHNYDRARAGERPSPTAADGEIPLATPLPASSDPTAPDSTAPDSTAPRALPAAPPVASSASQLSDPQLSASQLSASQLSDPPTAPPVATAPPPPTPPPVAKALRGEDAAILAPPAPGDRADDLSEARPGRRRAVLLLAALALGGGAAGAWQLVRTSGLEKPPADEDAGAPVVQNPRGDGLEAGRPESREAFEAEAQAEGPAASDAGGPVIVLQGGGGEIRLSPLVASLSGDVDASADPQPSTLTRWATGGSAVWQFRVLKPGFFRLRLRYSARGVGSDTRFVVQVAGDEPKSCELRETEGALRTDEHIVAIRRNSAQPLTLRALNVRAGAEVAFESLELTPVADASPSD